jgi:hypothetical protein
LFIKNAVDAQMQPRNGKIITPRIATVNEVRSCHAMAKVASALISPELSVSPKVEVLVAANLNSTKLSS